MVYWKFSQEKLNKGLALPRTVIEGLNESSEWSFRLSKVHLIECIDIQAWNIFIDGVAKVASIGSVTTHSLEHDQDGLGLCVILPELVVQPVSLVKEGGVFGYSFLKRKGGGPESCYIS